MVMTVYLVHMGFQLEKRMANAMRICHTAELYISKWLGVAFGLGFSMLMSAV